MNKTLNIEVFHGSLTAGIQEFRPASHFGGRLEALSAIGAKAFLDNVTDGKPILYKVSLKVPEINLFKAKEDWGKFGPQGALLPLRALMEIGADQKTRLDIAKRFNNYHQEINNANTEAEKITIGEKFLEKESGETYKVIQYSNLVEGRGDGYCVIDTHTLIIESFSNPTWGEVVEAFKNHGDWARGKDAAMSFMKSIGESESTYF
ncbi:hypothetical protein [Aquabacterium sp.]|uniref:hypothetical protein n=1 Tax=Aquabacterium sp. TaxID=1872578 RepID=UPI0025C5C4F5|nr:hypothetical protein [Aquabacterium sp.]